MTYSLTKMLNDMTKPLICAWWFNGLSRSTPKIGLTIINDKKIDAALGRCHSQSIVRLFKMRKTSPNWVLVSSNGVSDGDISNRINKTGLAFHKPDLNKDFSVLRQVIAIRMQNLELYLANHCEDSAFHKSMLLGNS